MRAEIRAVLAVARKDVRTLFRYRVAVFGLVFNPLYQGVIPAFLFGASFAVGGRLSGLEASAGTPDLAGYIFFGGLVSGIVSVAFWMMAMTLRTEMDTGTLEPSWLTPTHRTTFVIGRAVGGMAIFAFSQVLLFAVGIAFFGLTLDARGLAALPALVIALVAMIGVAHMLAAAALLIREANFFIDTTNYLFAMLSGVAFPIAFLPGVAQGVALLLPTTYAVDILRLHAIGTRPLFDPLVQHAILLGLALGLVALGLRVFALADHRLRVTGALAQH